MTTTTLTQAAPSDRTAIGSTPFEIDFLGRSIRVEFTSRARMAAQQLTTPLQIEMELYFSCLVRKAVRFRTADQTSQAELPPVAIAPNIDLYFRPVVTEECRVNEVDGAPPVKTMPAARPEALIPHWLHIDYRAGTWLGEFGY
ncbi:hypothetical protein QVG61_06680 [Thiohalobacter sp. IOR34]|uniref:hypothetical protein n=1 Tax=Thiohalobacter sp. IOR34 TaxID=3057176 RepID=UPI0025AF2F1A|nr:hypothetical protein [Thiohalobacter sp. IOR34]WJW76762.1 hypothetical protein QVG61_06680 [Thiohalobacter sp. IOR34]